MQSLLVSVAKEESMTFNLQAVNEAMNRGDFTALNHHMLEATEEHEGFMVLYSMVLFLHTRMKAQEEQLNQLLAVQEGDDT